MAVGGICIYVDAVQENGRNHMMSKHHYQPECGKSAGWRGTGRPNLSREKIKCSGSKGNREKIIFTVQLTTRRIGNNIRLSHTLLKL